MLIYDYYIRFESVTLFEFFYSSVILCLFLTKAIVEFVRSFTVSLAILFFFLNEPVSLSVHHCTLDTESPICIKLIHEIRLGHHFTVIRSMSKLSNLEICVLITLYALNKTLKEYKICNFFCICVHMCFLLSHS